VQIKASFREFFHWMGFALATPTLLYAGYPFYRGAIGGLRVWRLTMDLPIAIGLSVTYAYSAYITVTANKIGEVYFDTVTNLIFVILIGRYLEGMFRHQALSATKAIDGIAAARSNRDAGWQRANYADTRGETGRPRVDQARL